MFDSIKGKENYGIMEQNRSIIHNTKREGINYGESYKNLIDFSGEET